MHPHTNAVKIALTLSALILIVLLFRWSYQTYEALKLILMLMLIYASAFFTRPCRKIEYVDGYFIEEAWWNAEDGSLSGHRSKREYTPEGVIMDKEEFTEENSKILQRLKNNQRPLFPPISLRMALALLMLAFVKSPGSIFTLTRSMWITIDLMSLGIIVAAFFLVDKENSYSRSARLNNNFQPKPWELSWKDLSQCTAALWPIFLGGAFVLALLGTNVSSKSLKDTSMEGIGGGINFVLFNFIVLVYMIPVVALIWSSVYGIAGSGYPQFSKIREANSGLYYITIILLVYFGYVFSGFFSPEKLENPEPFAGGAAHGMPVQRFSSR